MAFAWLEKEQRRRVLPTLPRPIHSLRFPRLPRQLLLAPLEADEDPVRLVEEFPQGLDVNVLIPADHEDAGGARPSLLRACNTPRQRPGPKRPARPAFAPGRGPTSAPEEGLAHQHLRGAPGEAQLPGGRVRSRHHL